jgi:hypothetical protein
VVNAERPHQGGLVQKGPQPPELNRLNSDASSIKDGRAIETAAGVDENETSLEEKCKKRVMRVL